MTTQVAFWCGPFRTRVNGVCVARTTKRQVRQKSAGVRDGVEALAFGITETPQPRSAGGFLIRRSDAARWHPLTRNGPVISLHDYSFAAKSTCLPHGGQMRFTGLAALHAAAKLAPLSFSPVPARSGT